MQHLAVNTNGNVRRHTVGPGDVAHEQALGNPSNAMNFKFDGTSMGPNPNQIPLNLPMLQNQPINTFTIKDQHLLKPPMVMGASKLKSFYDLKERNFLLIFFLAGGFGRRASDGGANLQIFYPSSMNQPSQITNEDLYSRQNSHEFMMMAEQLPTGCQLKSDINMESSEDSNDEIQRYMHGRGCSKRHTVGCTDDLSVNPTGQSLEPPMPPIPSTSQSSSGRTRRTGLLTVMERPPGRNSCASLSSFSAFGTLLRMNFLLYRLFILISFYFAITYFFLLL